MKILNEKGLIHFASSGAPADKEGYLHKKGEVNKGFQKRWFVLKENLLFYFEKKGDKEPLGVIILEGCTIELAEDTDNFMFVVNFASSSSLRTYCLSANSQNSMESWMKALSCAGYEYVKLMVSELNSKLEELSNSAAVSLVQAAERESQILGRIYNEDPSSLDNVCRNSESSSLLRAEKKRVNPFNDLEGSSEHDPGDAFRTMQPRSSIVEIVTWSLLGVHSFAEMHEFARQQIEESKTDSSNIIKRSS